MFIHLSKSSRQGPEVSIDFGNIIATHALDVLIPSFKADRL